MKNLISNFGILALLVYCTITWTACEQEVEAQLESCETIVSYQGTNVCGMDSNHAAFSRSSDNSEETYFIANNFTDFALPTDLALGDELRVSFTIISFPPPGLLCGPLIVAPEVELSCLEVL